MATIRPRGDTWQAIVRHGKKQTLAKSFPSRAQAEAWAAGKELELKGAKPAVAAEFPDKVLVVYGSKTLWIAPRAWNDVMQAAGQMADGWQEHYGGLGRSQARIDAGLAALNDLTSIAL